jgi:serine/threonine-protein kinase
VLRSWRTGGLLDLPLFAELRRRRVFRALIGYAIAAFAVLQIIEPVMHGLHWPEAVLSYVVVALALGFPAVVFLAWIFDLRGGHIARTAPVAGGPQGVRLALLVTAIGAAGALPVVLYHFALREDRQKPSPAQTLAAGAPAIAVLPFVNMSSDKENEYFSEGITEELINALANIDGLRVVSRTAVFALKGKNQGIQQIGAELNVQTLLEGSVRREGSALRVTAQLIKVSDGYHLWSKTYDRELKSIFAVEDEIARSIADALQRKLVGLKPPTSSTQAHDLYLRGRYLWNKRSAEGIRKAAGYFEQAIREDPEYALAHAGLADALALRTEYDPGSRVGFLPKARAAALRALELDPALAEAHASLGLIAHLQYEHATALKEFRAALELKPEYAMARKWYGDQLAIAGRLQEARPEYERALQDDPTSLIINTPLAQLRLYDREYEGAGELLRKTLEMDPAFAPARGVLAELYILEGKYTEALAEAEKLAGGACPLELYRAYILAKAGRREEALALARGVERRARDEYVSLAQLGGLWIALGDKDKAFALLQTACEARDPGLLMLKLDPALDGVRSDPRYKQLLQCARLD